MSDGPQIEIGGTLSAGAVLYWPKHAGHYDLGGFCFSVLRKPSLFHRWAVRMLLGWKWVDA